MGTIAKYFFNFDDPYKILAHHIISYYRPADVVRILTENSYIKSCIIKEVRQMDMGGNYVDCIIQSILEEKSRMEYMHKLDELALYFYSKIDKERLRKEIRNILEYAGINLPDSYSTGGKVSSAKT